MRIDADELPAGAALEADVAVVGAGPAGIVLALELAGAGHDVLLIESGRARFDADAQRLADARLADPHHVPMDLATRRQLGGASLMWGGRCVPFDPVDFETRPVTGDASWPVGYAEVEPYFQRACDWMRCGVAAFNAREVPGLAGRSLVPGLRDAEVRASDLERWSLPTNYAREYGQRLRSSPLVRLVLGLTVTAVECDPDEPAHVARLGARTLAGRDVAIRARTYVLAAGGVEGTRLLLASDGVHAGGIGNHAGHLGRWYMAHVECRLGRAEFVTPPDQTIHGNERDPDGVYVRRRFTFAPELQREQELPNAALWLANPSLSDPAHGSGVLSLVYLILASPLGRFAVAEGIRQAHLGAQESGSVAGHVRNLVANLRDAARFAAGFGYGRYLRRGRKLPGFYVASAANAYPLVYHAEHVPHHRSHVRLGAERDALGVPRVETHLHFAEREVENAVRAHRVLDAYLRRQGVGRVALDAGDLEAAAHGQLFGGYHQAGTTRMSAAADGGVLDRDLRVHTVRNLHVASSSAFPTSGQANSTFMIVAFALRLAEHLDRSLRPAAIGL